VAEEEEKGMNEHKYAINYKRNPNNRQ
jgi:hypothetical protein